MKKQLKDTISSLLAPSPAPPLLPITSVDHYHMVQMLRDHKLGIPTLTISAAVAAAMTGLIKIQGGKSKTETDQTDHTDTYIFLSGYAFDLACLYLGLAYGRKYLEGFGILLGLLLLLAVIGSTLPFGFACFVWVCGFVCLATFLYTTFKHINA